MAGGRHLQYESDIRPGAWVVLKTGGPVMAVQACSRELAYCSWFTGESAHHVTFRIEDLCPADASAAATADVPPAINALKTAVQGADAPAPPDISGFGPLAGSR